MAPGQRDKRRQGELTKGVANKLARRMQPKRKKLTLFTRRDAVRAAQGWSAPLMVVLRALLCFAERKSMRERESLAMCSGL